MRKDGLLNQVLAAFLLPLIVFLPVIATAEVNPSGANVRPDLPMPGVRVSWQEYLAENLPPSVGDADRAHIYSLLSNLENAGREAYNLTAAGGLAPEEAARRVSPKVQPILTELVAIGTRIDETAINQEQEPQEQKPQEEQNQSQAENTKPEQTPQTTTAETAEKQAVVQQLETEIAELKEKIATIEREITAARGLRWQLRDTKVQLRKAAPQEKESLKAREKELKKELETNKRELKDLRKVVKREEKNGDQSDLENERARLAVLETLVNGDPVYPFAEKLNEVVWLRHQLAEKEKSLVALVPPLESAEADTPFAELARIVTLSENEVRELSLTSPLPKDKRLIESFHKELKRNYERKKRNLENDKKAMEVEKKTLQKQLKQLLEREGPKGVEERGAEADCRIFQIEKALAFYPIKQVALERAYDNFEAKSDLFADWPAKYAEIQAKLADNSIYKEKFMDYPLIGSRDLGYGDQAKDVAPGMEDEKQVREELERMLGYFPEEIQDPKVLAYFQSLARLMEQSSDLKVPLRVHVLKTPEVNAFAIRGGAVYFFAGLLVADKILEEKYKKKGLERDIPNITEAMLFGIFAHETAHITLRHTHRMMKPVTIAQILMTVAQIALMLGTGGYGLLAYLIYYYGLPFLSLALNLKLLGISREHETESDMVGAEYSWKAGFDPRGNIDWHEWLAKNLGYVRGAGYFYTHPPAYTRIWNLERVLAILPPLEGGGQPDSTEFLEIREIIWDILRGKELQDKVEAATKPTLRAKEIAAQKKREERCKPYIEDPQRFDPFDEAPFQTPFAIPSLASPAVCNAGGR